MSKAAASSSAAASAAFEDALEELTSPSTNKTSADTASKRKRKVSSTGASSSAKAKKPKKPVKSHNQRWEERYQELVEYKRIHGDCNKLVSTRGGKPCALYHWVEAQRKGGEDGTLKPERRDRLEALGFAWDLGRGRVQRDAPKKERKQRASAAVTNAVAIPTGSEMPVAASPPTGGQSQSSGSIEALVHRAARELGRTVMEAQPNILTLRTQWIFHARQLDGIDLDTLSKFIPLGLAKEMMDLYKADREPATVTATADGAKVDARYV